jgi:Mn2+/Fe2+ NRAMP family transporter
MIMTIANNHKIMGNRVNGRAINILGWTTLAIMAAAALVLILTLGQSWSAIDIE